MNNMKHKILSLLALLLTAVTGAWADGKVYDSSVNISTLQVGDILIEGAQITIPNLTHNLQFMSLRYFLNAATTPNTSYFLCDQTATVGVNGLMTGLNYGATARPADAEGKEGNAWEVTEVTANSALIVGITYAPNSPAAESVEVEWNAATKTGTFSMPGSDVVLTPIYAPTKVTLAANDVQKGSVSMGGETKVEWTPTTWSGWNTGKNTEMTKSDGGITMTYTNDAARPYDGLIMDDGDSHALGFLINEYIEDCTVTFSSDEGNISRIELSMTEEYSEETIPGTTYTYGNPHILPLDGWTFNGKSAVWEGEATNSLKLSSCSTSVEKITFYKDGAIPEGVTVNTDGTFTVAQTATVKVKAIPAEGYKLKGWSDAPDCTDLVREITIEPGEEDMNITAIFEEMTYTATFKAANANTIEAGKATVTVDSEQKTLTDGKLPEVKMGSEVKVKANTGYKFRKVEVKKGGAATLATALENGATVVIAFKYRDDGTCTFTNNNGTFTFVSGTGQLGGGNGPKQLSVENGKLIFKGSVTNSFTDRWSWYGFQVTFDPTANTYEVWKGSDLDVASFTSISVNGTDITDQLSELK